MNDPKPPKAPAEQLPPEIKAELLRRLENLPNERLIDVDQAFDQMRRNLRERSKPSPR
jgi:hypothetical protein